MKKPKQENPRNKYRVESLSLTEARKHLTRLEHLAVSFLEEVAVEAILAETSIGPKGEALIEYFEKHGIGWGVLADGGGTERVCFGWNFIQGISVCLHEKHERENDPEFKRIVSLLRENEKRNAK